METSKVKNWMMEYNGSNDEKIQKGYKGKITINLENGYRIKGTGLVDMVYNDGKVDIIISNVENGSLFGIEQKILQNKKIFEGIF